MQLGRRRGVDIMEYRFGVLLSSTLRRAARRDGTGQRIKVVSHMNCKLVNLRVIGYALQRTLLFGDFVLEISLMREGLTVHLKIMSLVIRQPNRGLNTLGRSTIHRLHFHGIGIIIIRRVLPVLGVLTFEPFPHRDIGTLNSKLTIQANILISVDVQLRLHLVTSWELPQCDSSRSQLTTGLDCISIRIPILRGIFSMLNGYIELIPYSTISSCEANPVATTRRQISQLIIPVGVRCGLSFLACQIGYNLSGGIEQAYLNIRQNLIRILTIAIIVVIEPSDTIQTTLHNLRNS